MGIFMLGFFNISFNMYRLIHLCLQKLRYQGISGIHPFIIPSTITAQNTPVNLNEESECNKHFTINFDFLHKYILSQISRFSFSPIGPVVY